MRLGGVGLRVRQENNEESAMVGVADGMLTGEPMQADKVRATVWALFLGHGLPRLELKHSCPAILLDAGVVCGTCLGHSIIVGGEVPTPSRILGVLLGCIITLSSDLLRAGLHTSAP